MEANSCNICRAVDPQKTVHIALCGHVFHESCLRTWFQTQREQGSPTSCPTCRTEVNFSHIVRMHGISKAPAATSLSVSRSAPDIRQTICERSRLLNGNESPESTTTRVNIRSRLLSILGIFLINGAVSRKVYSTLAIQLLLTFGFLSLTIFHKGSKQFACEHHEIITFFTCYVCGLIYRIASRTINETNIDRTGSIYLLTIMLAFGNLWNLELCETTIQTLLVAIALTALAAYILTKIAFKMSWSLDEKREVIDAVFFWLIVFFVIWRFADDKENSVFFLILQPLCLLLCCCYLIMFTQFMKEHSCDGPNEYITVAICLYVSTINMLIFTLRILVAVEMF